MALAGKPGCGLAREVNRHVPPILGTPSFSNGLIDDPSPRFSQLGLRDQGVPVDLGANPLGRDSVCHSFT